jgi:hypothetical protein
MTPDEFVDLALHVARSDAGIHGTVARPDAPPESFSGWLELTATVARVLAAAPPAGGPPGEFSTR